MGKHSGSGGSPFGRKHDHLSKSSRRMNRPLRTLDTAPGTQARGPKIADGSARRRGSLESAPARLKAERDRRRSKYRRLAAFAGIGIAVLLVVGAVGAYAYVRHLESTMQVTKTEKLVASLEKAEPQKPYNILLLGADKRPKETVYRTDTMILARIDPKRGKVWMISIPRDSRVEIEGHGYEKINQAFALGGPEGAIEAVKKLTGQPINHYMQADFKGFSKAVDSLGGVWIDVPVAIDDWNASSHSKHHAASKIDAGYQLLDGAHALTFVRARHQFADQDFSRMKNQQSFFKALADQVAKKENITRLPRVVTSVAPYVKTDMSLMEMIRTAQALRSAGGKSVYTATFPGEWISPYVVLDEEKKDEIVGKMKAGVSFDATSTPAAQESGDEATKKDPGDVTVTVRNGGGVSGCAKQASSILKARGFDVQDVGNANQFVYDKTLVVYKSDKSSAEQVAAALPPGTKVVESRGMYAFETGVLVVIGKDWDLAKVPVTAVNTN